MTAVQEEPPLSVAEAIQVAMNDSSIKPHLPLKASAAQRLKDAKRAAPIPLWTAANHQVTGFNPSPVQATPHVDNTSAINEHAFAGRDENRKRPFKAALGMQAMRHGSPDIKTPESIREESRPSSSAVSNGSPISRPPSSPLLPPPEPPHVKQQKQPLRSSKSLGDGLKKGWRHRFSAPNKNAPPVDRDTMYSLPVNRPSMASVRALDEARDSYRSALTSNSSFLHTSSINTDLSSMTGNSSQSDFVKVYPNWPETEEEETEGEGDGGMGVEDVIGLYVDGFESGKPSMDTQGKRSSQADTSRPTSRPTSQPSAAASPQRTKRPVHMHRRSQSASLLERAQGSHPSSRETSKPGTPADHKRTFTRILSAPVTTRPTSTQLANSEVPRDRYGFKKSSHYISAAQYDTWNVTYTEHLERRSKKWHALMHSYGLSTDEPYRFPPKSDKVKRYVRKGIPPEFRGAAWFWYAGGPNKLAKEPGLYLKTCNKVRGGELRELDREHIERDLNRTFPDNIRFKPDPSTMVDAQAGAGGGEETEGKAKGHKRKATEPETPIVQSLRRVLQAFAVHNPGIGYCQSLNFIAGLLLLFLDEDEEKTFVLLNIVTHTYLPGTHGVALEGANIDIAVLMLCIKDTLPAVWAKIDDKGGTILGGPAAQSIRLPTVSLATTAWFMSLFVGTLPIESVLRVWDCLFFEGSKTLFRIALSIFKYSEASILALQDPMEIFQLVQTVPRGMLDINGLLEICFRRRGGYGHVSQEVIEKRREERREQVRDGVATLSGERGWRARFRAKARVVG